MPGDIPRPLRVGVTGRSAVCPYNQGNSRIRADSHRASARFHNKRRSPMAWESDFELIDERFKGCVKDSARVEKLAEGCRWAEGPAYFPAGRYVVWSDIPNDRILRWDETSGVTSVFRQPAGYTNGHTVD